MSATNEESIPSEKMRELEDGKVVVKPTTEEKAPILSDERKKASLYLLISELTLLGILILSFTLMGAFPSLFFSITFATQ